MITHDQVSSKIDASGSGRGGPLAGLTVLDLSRLAPGPYGSMLLADLGARVIVVGGGRTGLPVPALSPGKEFIRLDLKTAPGLEALRVLASQADVLIEGFRPGVADRLGVGYAALSEVNPALVYCSVTGYGQTGELAQRAGHDINYLAVSGALATFGTEGQPPTPPLNLLADFAGGGMLAVVGILAALVERQSSGRGQYIDAAMVDGVLSLMTMDFADWGSETLPRRGHGVLTGTMPVYRCYECADGEYVAVGALEDQFFATLWTTLSLGELPDHLDPKHWSQIESRLTAAFKARTRDEWAAVFDSLDACVTPVIRPDELAHHPYVKTRHPDFAITRTPVVPVLGRTPGRRGPTCVDDVTAEVLEAAGVAADVRETLARQAAESITGLSWPPVPRPNVQAV
jgi:alpha-methylacyl-CoA racemase